MSSSRGRRQGGRRRGSKAKPVDLWRPVPPLPDPEPIVAATDPGLFLRSLGDPPLDRQGGVAQHYLAAVAERAAMIATALAATADLLEQSDEDETIFG